MAPEVFASVRLAAGAGVLWFLLMLRRKMGGAAPAEAMRRIGGTHVAGAAALLVYLYAFSWAYGAIATGTGALVLFTAVQVTMFAGAVVLRDPPPLLAWLGSAVALLGLVMLLAPEPAALLPALAMCVAGAGWGVYSLLGRRADPLGTTASQFVLALPVALAVLAGHPPLRGEALWLAVASGVVTSALGYALWYAVLPRLGAGRAAVAQLAVPLIAAVMGLTIGEPLGWRFVGAAVLVIGGIGLASYRRIGSSGS